MTSALQHFKNALAGEGLIFLYGGCRPQAAVYVEHGGAHEFSGFSTLMASRGIFLASVLDE